VLGASSNLEGQGISDKGPSELFFARCGHLVNDASVVTTRRLRDRADHAVPRRSGCGHAVQALPKWWAWPDRLGGVGAYGLILLYPLTWKTAVLLAVPPWAVTEIAPVTAPFGTFVVILVLDLTVKAAAVPAKETAPAPVNPGPVRVRRVGRRARAPPFGIVPAARQVLEVPVVARVLEVLLPVVGIREVAAVPVHRQRDLAASTGSALLIP